MGEDKEKKIGDEEIPRREIPRVVELKIKTKTSIGGKDCDDDDEC